MKNLKRGVKWQWCLRAAEEREKGKEKKGWEDVGC